MFYSETLLSKTGPLARVWLSANIERKLTKANILQSNIESSVNAIVDQGQAPMALRLSGQLLLGVVRIYSRKARYLMDDCNDALVKLKTVFRPGNPELFDTVAGSEVPNANLTLPDVLPDVLNINALPLLDDSFFNTTSKDLGLGFGDNDPLNWHSQLMSDPISVEQGRNAPEDQPMFYPDDLPLDIDFTDGMSMEKGRDAPPARSIGDDLIDDHDKFDAEADLGLDLGDDGPLHTRLSTEFPPSDQPEEHPGEESPAPIEDPMDIEPQENFLREDFSLNIDDAPAPFAPLGDPRLKRDSQSPLSSARSSVVREFDETMLSEEPSVHQARQPATKKRRLLPLDQETTIHNSQIKKQQEDRSAILKPLNLLPRDPVLLALMNMQQNGGFVSNIMGEGRCKGWAPELRGILSIELIRKSSAQKRKRDSGVADLDQNEEEEEQGEPMPQLEIPEDEDLGLPVDEGIALADSPRREASTMINLPADKDRLTPPRPADQEIAPQHQPQPSDDDDQEAQSPLQEDPFDYTTIPLIPLSSQGPISLGTKHAVHLLRDCFSSSADISTSTSSPSQSSQQNPRANVLFQGLLPEHSTSKADATKMFFEVLVLATKDAVKVEQKEGVLGGGIRLRAKRGLWGDWAEKEAGGEIAGQQGEEGAQEIAVSA